MKFIAYSFRGMSTKKMYISGSTMRLKSGKTNVVLDYSPNLGHAIQFDNELSYLYYIDAPSRDGDGHCLISVEEALIESVLES